MRADLRHNRVDPEEGPTFLLMIQHIPNRTDIGQKFPTLIYQALVPQWSLLVLRVIRAFRGQP